MSEMKTYLIYQAKDGTYGYEPVPEDSTLRYVWENSTLSPLDNFAVVRTNNPDLVAAFVDNVQGASFRDQKHMRAVAINTVNATGADIDVELKPGDSAVEVILRQSQKAAKDHLTRN